MDPFYPNWQAGWLRGMAKLGEAERATVFAECGKACAQPELLPIFQGMLAKAAEPNDFFTAVDAEIEGISVNVIQPGETYDFIYPRCLCPLHTQCGVQDALLCECSRGNQLYLMRMLFPERTPHVEILESVLRGDAQCRLRVRFTA
ncbi:MAG: hypothetical protein LLF96_04470 [Eubacteriales bacterium]|nr:hypothetical protein [Eubacteriales bacterium]